MKNIEKRIGIKDESTTENQEQARPSQGGFFKTEKQPEDIPVNKEQLNKGV